MWRSGCFFCTAAAKQEGERRMLGKKPKETAKVVLLELDSIQPSPFQARRHFDQQELESLAGSIVRNGLLQPISVRRLEKNKYELIAGERRLRAAKLAGLERIPAIITEHDDLSSAVLGLEENTQRQQLNCFEQARGLRELIRLWDCTQAEAAKRLGMAQPTLANKLRLLVLTDAQQQLCLEGNLTERHARAVLALEDAEKRTAVLEQAARRQWDEIIALKTRIGITGNAVPARRPSPTFATDTFHIRHIHFEGADPKDQSWLLKISGLKENSDLTVQQLQDAVSILVGTNAYRNINYKLIGDKNRDLIFNMQDKTNSAINVGVRFDSEDIVAALLNVTYDHKARYHSKIALTGRIGKRAYGRLDYAIERSPLRNINFSYMFDYNNTDINYHGKKNMNTTFRHHLLEVGYTDVNWLSFKLNLGVRYEYFDFNTPLYTTDHLQTFDIRSKGYINYFISAHLETLDRNYFPSKGISLKADYTIYTDNFVTNEGHTLTSALGLNFKAVLPVTSHFSFIPAVNGRVLIGNDHGFPYLNMAGGEQFGKYFQQQLPFAGISHVEIFNNSLIIAQLTCRQRISQNHYISLIANYALHHDNLFELLKGESVWGGSLGYAYNSIAGPLSASLGLSNRNKNVQFNLNLGFFF